MHHLHVIGFIQDLALIMLIAGVITVLFHILKQPVVLGYIVAGIILGPHTPPFELIRDKHTIHILGELGVVFLMFSLGLEFNLRKLAKVGVSAAIVALLEITVMLWLGYEIGLWFGWKAMDALFLGAMLAISSTTIIVKALDELGLKRQRFAQMIFGILIVEDLLAIAMIALLSGIANSSGVDAGHIMLTLCNLILFMVVSLTVGILLVPRLLQFITRFKSDEVLLVVVLGLCFGFCLVVVQFGYSIALGAFMSGAVMAESRALHAIERVVAPLRDMFSAIFFVAIGLMLDPRVLSQYAWPIAVITVAVVIGKVVSCSLGILVAGHNGRTAMRVGMSMAQIGEFSFIIASLGLLLKVTSDFLYPIAVSVSVLTTLFTPYLIRAADPLTHKIGKRLPRPFVRMFNSYAQWLSNLQPEGDGAALFRVIRSMILQIGVNLALVAAIFLGLSYFEKSAHDWLAKWLPALCWQNAVLWSIALMLSMPFLVAVYRKFKSLAMLLAEVSVRPAVTGRFTKGIRCVLAELIPVAAMGGIFVLVAALSSSILPPADLLIAVLVCATLLLFVMWRWFVRIHAKLQIALHETLQPNSQEVD